LTGWLFQIHVVNWEGKRDSLFFTTKCSRQVFKIFMALSQR
jgi:hypothetical protein